MIALNNTIRLSFLGLSILCVAGVYLAFDYWSALPRETKASFVGRQACIDCHQKEAAAYAHSHHDLAMDLATEETVLGDFNNASLEHYGVSSRMYRDGNRFMVETEGPDGKLGSFEVKYVFGVDPLQQYMVEFDRSPELPLDAIARLQVLRISWDTKNKRWFYLSPPDVDEKLSPDDDLHWTGIAQRWNTMCADCHSTNLRKNFDPQTNQYATTFAEMDVSCEACHGPGSTHVELATSKSLFWDRNLGYGLVHQLKGADATQQIETCAPCHSRRGLIAEGFQPGDEFCDFFAPSSLESMLYHADGQILDEVYVYGSFLQSKMYHKGIRCTDCHDPHSLQLKHDGNKVCTSCHQHPAGKYDTPAHHKHAPGTAGAQCVDCHMPATTYMMVDPRRDHSIRVPRPDLSVELGTPNACSGCHLKLENVEPAKREKLTEYAAWLALARAGDAEVQAEIRRVDQWCEEACQKWYGDQRQTPAHYATTLHRSRQDLSAATTQLDQLARDVANMPAIARATALDALAEIGEPTLLPTRISAGKSALEDPSPVVRVAAVRAVAGEALGRDGTQRVAAALGPKLEDPSRLVRYQVARSLASSGAYRELNETGTRRFKGVIDEIRQSVAANADRAGAHMDWAQLCEQLGRYEEAIESYRTAIRVEPRTVGPRSNLAGLLEQMLQAQATSQGMPPRQLVDLQTTIKTLRKQELPLLERDAALVSENAAVQYRLGLAYYLDGQLDAALKQLERANQLEENEQFALALKLLKEKMSEQNDRPAAEGAPTTSSPDR